MAADRTHPLIVTALMGDVDFAWANGLRRTHFPPERNVIPAHITLFHHLPPARHDELLHRIRQETAASAPAAVLSRVINLGRGVAFAISSPELLALRERIADAFADDLTPQDRHALRLHVTVQNKVTPARAKKLFDTLSAGFAARPLVIEGLAIWHYLGGPWQLAAKSAFCGRPRR